MAAMAAPAPPAGSPAQETLSVPSRNPLPLSASQEAQVRDIYYARVRKACSDEIKAFADCAMGRTLSIPFVCRTQHRAMNSCMVSRATQAEQDAAREEWFAQRLERQRERERKARKKAGQEEFLREWWGLPEKDEETRRREEEKLTRGERIGGYAAKNRVRWDEAAAAVAAQKPDDKGSR
ncbi:cytochrome c oxidase biogenesis protein Cmc1 like-domain-containing protein [Plectosphaerella plurivora]|uniref:COX assembly mitochondrial protein n=1 Tax=Plectosphaerella plurivora TaxID=936078 RepID=A0A9P8VIF2_9PEZI|nr:cytochrome c oxidase biogenesis protein Cmc1 like-domain-containing protein [Plectosphaerella plurivora]